MNSQYRLVTIITPTYNRAHVIQRAINSVLNQTFTDFEYIIIDDGSIDNTQSLIEHICSFNPLGDRIRFHKHIKNQGQNAALNTGLSLAKGKYIAFLDSDDEWLPDMLAEQMRQFNEDADLDCSYTWPGFYNRRKELVPGRRYSIKGYLYKEALAQGYICNPTTLMAKKECFDQMGGFKTEFVTCQDDDICLRLAKTYKFGLVPSIMAIIHDDAGNQTISNRRVYADDWYKLFNKYEQDILAYCGKPILAKHFIKCAKLYLEIGDNGQAKTVVARSLSLKGTLEGYFLLVLCQFPAFISKNILKVITGLQRRLSR